MKWFGRRAGREDVRPMQGSARERARLRNIELLGYRGVINHYVGMSHYFRLEQAAGGLYASLAGGVLNTPCLAWHRDFAALSAASGRSVIWSLSYELFDDHCWGEWKQRAADGSPALTGWVPPSTLLSPAHGGAMAYGVRMGDADRAAGRIAAAGLSRVAEGLPGDVVLMRSGPGQLHLGILTPGGMVHADAGLRRVVERPGAPPWPVIGWFRGE